MDLVAIADAIATKYATLPAPSGETLAMRGATARPPSAITKPPYVVVTASVDSPAAVVTRAVSGRGMIIPFNIDFFLEKAQDTPRTMLRLERWVPSLMDAMLTGTHLGMPTVVAESWADSFQLGDLMYAGQKWAGVRVVAMVHTSEAVTYSA